MIGNGLGIVPLHVSMIGVKPSPEPGEPSLEPGEPSFDNEVQDILK